MRRIFPSLTLLLLVGTTAAGAQTNKPKAPAPAKKPQTTAVKAPARARVAPPPLAPARPLALPKIVERTLSNGLRIVLLEDHAQPALWMRLAVPAGTIRDPKDKVGLAAMTAGLLDKGTTTRTETQIADIVDGLGATLDATAEEDYLIVSANGLSAYADTLLELMADITLRPTFPQEELDRYRTRTLSQITASLAEPGNLATAALDRRIFGAHPYGNYAAGTRETLTAIKQADLAAFRSAYFAPNAATLFIVGDITPDAAVRKAETALGAWARQVVPALPAAPSLAGSAGRQPEIVLINRPGAAQTEIRIGAITPGYADPRRIVGSVATAVLGLGQFEGRLTREIRVKRGLSYGAASYFSRNKDAGSFRITTFTKNPSTAEVVRIALAEARRLTREPAPAAELQERKDFLIGSFAVSVATPTGLLQRLVPAVLYGNGPDDLTRYAARVQAVTPAQIREVMSSLPLGGPQVVLVGDAKAIEKDIRPLGRLTIVSSDAVNLLSPTLQTAQATATPAPAQPVATAQETAEGKARLQAAVRAHGGDAFLNVKQLVMKGKGEVSPPQLDAPLPIETMTLTLSMPDRARLDMKTGFGDIVIAAPGGTGGGGWFSALGQVQDAPPGAGAGAGDPLGLLRRATQEGFAVRPLPDTENGKPITSPDGKTLIGFSVTDDTGKTSRIYMDAHTTLERPIVPAHGPTQSFIQLSDYKPADAFELPVAMQVQQGGKQFLRLTFDSFEVNKPVKDDLFARPKQ